MATKLKCHITSVVYIDQFLIDILIDYETDLQ